MPAFAHPIPYTVQPSIDGFIVLHDAAGEDTCLVPNGDNLVALRTAELIQLLTRVAYARNRMTDAEIRRSLDAAAAL